MNDDQLDQLLNAVMKVETEPDLWVRVRPKASPGLTWREVRWACILGSAVLTAWAMVPQKSVRVQADWEPVALKLRVRSEAVAAIRS